MNILISLLILRLLIFAQPAPETGSRNPHGQIGWECLECHTTKSWTPLDERMKFSHGVTGFPLAGRHSGVACRSCHQDLLFSRVGSACADCHADIHQAQFGVDCEKCHTPKGWTNDREIISLHASRGFPLIGVHAAADCDACHRGQQAGEYAGTPVDCQGCHAANFAATSDPNHVQSGFKAACQDCHPPTASSWKATTYQHTPAFILHGGHTGIGCINCHSEGYANTSPECFSCHEAQFNATTDPAHVAFGFPTTCAACHNDVSWSQAQFEHVQASGFALTGAHGRAPCTACHIDNQLTGLPRECYGCHADDFAGTTDPGHVAGNFPQDCLLCHSEETWAPATFNHANSRFPLTGAHTNLQCAACHSGGYLNTPYDCYSCHQADYSGARNPDHAQNNFDHNCLTCHSTGAWQPAVFSHDGTRFPLTGAHTSLQCISCHAGGYQNTPFDCYSCHADDYNRTTDPDHAANGFSHDCTQCHSTTRWEGDFNHSNLGFPLTGAHASLGCVACHSAGYQNTPSDCYTCHQSDYGGVTDPNHIQNNFSHDCTQCHTTAAWAPASFDHNSTRFPLTGAHGPLQCLACHASGYQNTPTECYSCHETAFNGVADPNHVQNNFSHICTPCHTTSAWTPATYDHNLSQFPLTGAHLSVPCQSCHTSGYDNTPSDCAACHQGDYDNTANPNHRSAGFPTQCQNCHNTTAWTPSTWNHDSQYFPIYSGRHRGEWNVCADCHVNPNDYHVFECIFCHEHNQPDTDEHHLGVPGYQYNSQACYNCHPSGGARTTGK